MATFVATASLFPAVAFGQTTPTPPASPVPSGQSSPPAAASTGGPAAVRQTFTFKTTVRRYQVGDADVDEQAAPMAYQLAANRLTLRLAAAPVGYSAASTSIRGTTPFSARLDYRFAGGTGVRVYGQTSSAPGTLTAGETLALGAAGTPTLDLESLSLGTPALVGARVSHDLPKGSTVFTVHGAAEVQPRPSGSDPVYWRGRTVRGGLSLAARAGDARFTGGIEGTRSFADALDGRNLFPGGGTVSLTASGSGPLGGDSLTFWQLFGFYFRPINSARPDQPNRLIPVGDFMSVHTSLSIPVGTILLWPAVDISREASHTISERGLTRTRIDGTGWTTNAGATVTVPVARGLELTPGAGYVFGSVGASLVATTTFFEVRDAFSSRIRGTWVSIEISARF